MRAEKRLRVLALSRNYPNRVLPRLGLWARNLMHLAARFAEVKVISPVPWCPPLPGLPEDFRRFRDVERSSRDGSIETFYPRMVVPPGNQLHAWESLPYSLAISGIAGRLHGELQFDLIHGHFVYPDGYVAARLGRRWGIPVVLTEHALWQPWMDNFPSVRKHARWTVRNSAVVHAVSQSLRESMESVAGKLDNVHIIPNVVDGSVFTIPSDPVDVPVTRIVFVGILRWVKGVDILFRAVRVLKDRGIDVQVAVVGESLYRDYRRDHAEFLRILGELQLQGCVKFLGSMTPEQVAAEMQHSTLLVLPSRRETFGTVLAEALACGTPVVATRCGGTEEIVTKEVGVLVPPEDPEALANGIMEVLGRRASYQRQHLRDYALARYGADVVADKLKQAYNEALGRVKSGV